MEATLIAALLDRLTGAGVAHEPVETCPNAVRHVDVCDRDGNVIAIAAPPAGAG